MLFAHDATSGTFVPAKRAGEYRLTLRGVPTRTLFFADRPNRTAGRVTTRRMLDGFYAKPGAVPPNAAISATARSGRQYLVALELIGARYDARRGRIVYRARKLHGPASTAVAHRDVDTTATLPSRFGRTSVFIDTFYNDCQGSFTSPTGVSYTLTTSEAYSEDTWTYDDDTDGHPFGNLQGTGGFEGQYQVYWQTTSGWARGCWNHVVYTGTDGSVADMWVRSPYTGQDVATCTGTGTECLLDLNLSNLRDNPDSLFACFATGPYGDCLEGRVDTRPMTSQLQRRR